MIKSCSECKAEIPADALLCQCCGEAVDGIRCEQCKSVVHKDAKICKWCGSQLLTEKVTKQSTTGFIKGEVLPSLLLRFRFLPHEVTIKEEKIVVRTPGLFRLWNQDDEIPWNKIAGFNYRNGIFWDQITIETRGQKGTSIVGLEKQQGQKLKSILESLET